MRVKKKQNWLLKISIVFLIIDFMKIYLSLIQLKTKTLNIYIIFNMSVICNQQQFEQVDDTKFR